MITIEHEYITDNRRCLKHLTDNKHNSNDIINDIDCLYYFLMDIYEEINKYELKSNRIIIRDENGNIVKSCNNPSGDIGDWEWV